MAQDKQLHFAAGFLIAASVGMVTSPLWGFSAAVIAGILKEFRDWCTYRDFDEKDAEFTWLGGMLGTLVAGAASWIF